MNRNVTQQVISAYRATAIVDTPMRKIEVLESVDGMVILRSTEYGIGSRDVSVKMIHLERHEAISAGKTLLQLEDDMAEVSRRTA